MKNRKKLMGTEKNDGRLEMKKPRLKKIKSMIKILKRGKMAENYKQINQI
jgi:hypothetical protein